MQNDPANIAANFKGLIRIQKPGPENARPQTKGPFSINQVFKALKETLKAKETVYSFFINALNEAYAKCKGP